MSRPESGRRPELRDEARDHERDARSGREGRARSGPGDPMKHETANEPASVEEGRCQRCGEEILPVPT